MSNQARLYDAFDECLTRLKAGQSLTDCLRAYPDLAAELRPMLVSAQATLSVSRVPRPAQMRSRAKFLTAAGERRPKAVAAWWQPLSTVLALGATLMIVGLALSVVTKTVLNPQTPTASPNVTASSTASPSETVTQSATATASPTLTSTKVTPIATQVVPTQTPLPPTPIHTATSPASSPGSAASATPPAAPASPVSATPPPPVEASPTIKPSPTVEPSPEPTDTEGTDEPDEDDGTDEPDR